MKKKLITILLSSCMFISLVGTSNIVRAAEVDNKDTKTGVKEENEAGKQWIKENITELKDIKLNNLAKKRISESNKGKNYKGFKLYSNSSDESLPVKVDNSTLNSFPNIDNQAELASCVSFSATYYLMSHMVNLFNGLDDPNNNEKKDKVVFSPKWTYNNVNGGKNDGTYQSNTYEFIKKSGAAYDSDFPYEGKREPYTNYTMWSTNSDLWKKAQKYSVNEFHNIKFKPVSSPKDHNLDDIKKLLCNGYILSMNTNIESTGLAQVGDDKKTKADDGYVGEFIYRWTNKDAVSEHAITIVGYNDDIWVDMNGDGEPQDGERGAFKVANSWGENKEGNNKGFFWVSYDAFNEVSAVKNNQLAQENRGVFSKEAIVMEPKILDEEPKLYAKFTLNTSNRNECNVTLKADNGKESKTFTPYQLDGSKRRGELSFRGTKEACDGSFAIDLTKVISEINSDNIQDYTWTLEVTDNDNNKSSVDLKGFSIVDENSNNEYVSDINGTVSANGNTVLSSIKPSDINSNKNIVIKDIRNDKEFRAYTSEEGKEVTLCADVYGGRSNKSFTYTITGSSNKDVINSDTSTIKWTPNKAGEYEINLKVTDSDGNTEEFTRKYKVYNKIEINYSCNINNVTNGVYNVPLNNMFKVNLNVIGGLEDSYISSSRMTSFFGDFDMLKYKNNESVIYMIPRAEDDFGILAEAKDKTDRKYEKVINYKGYDDGSKVLDKPKNIKVEYLDNINEKISWDPVTGAEGYYVMTGCNILDIVSDTSYTFPALKDGACYVMAFNKDKCSRQKRVLNLEDLTIKKLEDENNAILIKADISMNEGELKYTYEITDRNTGEIVANELSDSNEFKCSLKGSGHYLIKVSAIDSEEGNSISKSVEYDLE